VEGYVTLGSLLLTMFLLCRLGAPQDALARFVFVVRSTLTAGSLAAIWLVAAFGLGVPWRPVFADARHSRILQLCCGLATALWLAHLLAWLGIGTTRLGAAVPIALGLVLVLAHSGEFTRHLQVPWIACLLIPGIAILIVASSSMPGWLWDSEAFGYDVLSYHLRLPQEWIELGRLQGVAHNFFSYMPSYVEAAYLQIGALWGSMHAYEGLPLLTAQFLQAWLTLLIAAAIGAKVVAELADAPSLARTSAGALAASCFLLTPWTQVMGSLAYDEPIGSALLFAALLVEDDDEIAAGRKGALAGWLVGAALCTKLTTAILAVPILAMTILLCPDAARRTRCGVAAGSTLLLALAPYLVRNLVSTGNPLFPFATRWLGLGHWHGDQLARWHAELGFSGGMGDRIATVRASLGHSQWANVLWLIAGAVAIGLWRHRTRHRTIIYGAPIVVAAAVWFAITPRVPRYLVPLLVPGAIVCGAVAGDLLRTKPRSLLAVTIAVAALLGWSSLRNFSQQRSADPAAFLGPRAYELWTGGAVRGADSDEQPPMIFFINFRLPPKSLVYAIGDARTLYVRSRVIYYTAWDRWLLADLVHAEPDDPESWLRGLINRGITHLWVNYAELERLWQGGFCDPAVTPELVRAFAERHARAVAQSANSTLYELVPQR
jgi:hypothetical protein